MLFIGMGTEVVVFFLSAFDRPFDKEEIGKELPHDYQTDEEIAESLGLNDDDEVDDEAEDTENTENETHTTPAAQPAASAASAQLAAATPAGAVPFDAEAKRLAEIIRLANDELLRRAQAALSPEMEEATQQYIEKLRTLAQTFEKVDEQSARLAHDSEEMANLNRTLTAINKTYDLHFKSISQQVGTIDQINEQTRKLAQQIEELNGVYSRMIQALTVKMTTQN